MHKQIPFTKSGSDQAETWRSFFCFRLQCCNTSTVTTMKWGSVEQTK